MNVLIQFSLLLIVLFCLAAHIGTPGRGGGCGIVTGNPSFFMIPSIQFLNSLTLANTELLSFAEHLNQSNISIFRRRAFAHYNRFN